MASTKRRERRSASRRAAPERPAHGEPMADADRQSTNRPFWALAWSETGGVRALTTFEEFTSVYGDASSRVWIDLQDPDRELLLSLGSVLELHPLVTEDILERNQRAKVEQTGEALHIVMFALRYEGEVVAHEMDIVLGKRFLLTSHDADVSPRDAPFMRRDPGAHLSQGVDYCLWSISDWLVDDYFPVFDRLGDEIDDLEADVMHKPSSWVVERLFAVRRDLLQIRHAVNPQREIFNQLTNRDLALIRPERLVYFRDVYDHLIRLTDELDSYRELVSTTLDIYLSQVNNNLSEIMKRLTSVTVVLAGIGAIAGIFGMSEAALAFNFQEGLGFWIITLLTVGVGAGALLFFRRIGWI
jgi:magnesium transporter